MASNNITPVLKKVFTDNGFDQRFFEIYKGPITLEWLEKLDEESLEQATVGKNQDERKAIINSFRELKPKAKKIINDSVHGHIELNSVCLAIIDTPEFQRLRYIKQLGMTSFVYPGACHNRFEHSLGVYHLAGEFARTLQKNQPYLKITDKDILCVEITGLCHDIGHGPFSHVFDGVIIPRVFENSEWTHEKTSVKMFEYLIDKERKKSNDEEEMKLREGILKENGLDKNDIEFITNLILGKMNRKDKPFLYEETENLYNMFHTRNKLYRIAYQHKVTKVIEAMFEDAMKKAKEHLKYTNQTSVEVTLSECIKNYDIEIYSQLTDNILHDILKIPSEDNNQEILDAKEIIRRIFDRDLYTCVYTSDSIEKDLSDQEKGDLHKELRTRCQYKEKEEDFVVQYVKFDYGAKEENPLSKLLVYEKENELLVKPIECDKISKMSRPEIFSETQVRVLIRNKNKEKISLLKKGAEEWFEKQKKNLKRTAQDAGI